MVVVAQIYMCVRIHKTVYPEKNKKKIMSVYIGANFMEDDLAICIKMQSIVYSISNLTFAKK